MVYIYEFKSKTSPRKFLVAALTQEIAIKKVIKSGPSFKSYKTKPAPYLVKQWYDIKNLGILLV